MLNLKKTKGFTLIELLVVISIIALLASIVLTSVNAARTKARDTVRYSDIQQIHTAIELYINSNGAPPYFDCSERTCDIPDSSSLWQNDLANMLAPYIASLPTDPCGENCPSAVPFDRSSWFGYEYTSPKSFQDLCYDSGDSYSFCTDENLSLKYYIFAEHLETTGSPYGFGSFGSF